MPTRAALLRDAASVLRDPSRATFVVLHDRAEAWALADRLIVLLDGQLAASGEPRAVLERPPSRAVADVPRLHRGRARERAGALRAAGAGRAGRGSPLRGDVARRVPEEDGVLCEVTLDGGTVQVRDAVPGPGGGRAGRLRLEGGVEFEA